MNLIDKDKLIKAFEKECVGECACCRSSIRGTGECGLIADFDVEIELVRCEDCDNKECWGRAGDVVCGIDGMPHRPDWFCADGVRE